MEKKEAKILDYILKELLKTTCLSARDLKPLDNGFNSNNEDVKESVYKQHFISLKMNGIVRLENGINNKTEIYAIPEITKEFLSKGGFKALVEKENRGVNRESEIEELQFIKLKSDAKISKWQVRTFWPIFIFGLVGFIFGIVNFIDQRKDKKIIEEVQQSKLNIQEEVYKLRTLVLDQRNIDSLHNSKSSIDSLRKN